MTKTALRGHSGARDYLVWDPLVRVIHWPLVLAIIINSFNDAEGDLHELLGYLALCIVALRLVWGIIGSQYARFSAFPPNPRSAWYHFKVMLGPTTKVHLSHNPLGALMVYNIWLTVITLGLTGYLMGTYRFFGVAWVEDVHKLAYNWLLISIALHIGGVFFDIWRTKVPLIRAMVTGHKRIPNKLDIE